MSASIDHIDNGSSEEKQNNYALKLLGIDIGNLRDEEILEFISNYVRPSSIKALFYDSFNLFYVLHLNDTKSTCILVGKTLQMSCYRVHFLPLFESFVIGNVYMNITNGDLRNIFNMFGNVVDVTNHHVLPNSSKFFHVLSGTREITFLLPGDDTEVQIPITVSHPPFTFHVHQLCLLCLRQGHSTLKCPDREDKDVEDTPLPTISGVGYHKESLNENSLVFKQEFPLSVSKEDHSQEKSVEVNVGKAAATSPENCLSKKKRELPEIEVVILEGDFIESEDTRPKFKNASPKQSENVLKEKSSVNKEKHPKPKASKEKNVQKSVPSRPSPPVSPLLEKYILKVHGVLDPHDIVELMQTDARNRRNVISFVSNITSDFKLVLAQLRKTLRKYLRDEHFSRAEFKYKKKLLTLIKVLKGT